MHRTFLTIAALAIAGGTAFAAEAQPEGHRVAVNGMQMYYEVSGAGEPMIVLHGSFINIPSMGKIVGRLAETHRVYALELQGHGRTTDIDRPITYPNLASDVAAFMDAVGVKKADVFGYSLGAVAGLRLAIDHPEKVDQLIVAAGVFAFEGWQKTYRDFVPKMTVDMFTKSPLAEQYKKLAPNPDAFPALVEKLIALEKAPFDWRDELAAVKMPVLIMAGDADAVSLDHAVEMFHLLGGGVMGDMGKPLSHTRLAILPATSHTALIGQVDLMMQFIGPFLAGETPKGWSD